MELARRPNNAVHWFIQELTHRVVAKSGRPSDRYHLGKLILQSLKDSPDEFVLQIDGGNGQSETCGSVLERSVQCEHAFRAMGLQTGDVIVLMAPNHLDLCIPLYAALYVGVTIASIDYTLGVKELLAMFSKDEPKLVFCQSEKAPKVRAALSQANLAGKVVTFDEEKEVVEKSLRFDELLKVHGQGASVKDFNAADFEPESTIAFLVSTSGTTGLPKQAVTTHKNFAIASPTMWSLDLKFPTPTRSALIVSPLQWATALLQFLMSPVLRYTRLQTSKLLDNEHVYSVINTYKPTQMLISPTMLTSLVKYSNGRCDWTCFDWIAIGGGAVAPELIRVMKEMTQSDNVYNGFGISEICGVGFYWNNVPKSIGQGCQHLLYRLVKAETQEDIVEPNVTGELWMKGPTVFKGYYKDEETTKKTLTEDGWVKTGDLFYRDDHWNYFFVERFKMLLKYKNHQVSPAEIQDLILTHPAVLDCAVYGLPDQECGDLPVACVVRRPGHSITAEEVKNLVKENLTDTKQLRGGVIFLDQLPLTANGKTNHKKLNEIVLTANRE